MAADIEKVIKALELCANGCNDDGCVYLEEQNRQGGLAKCRCVDLLARDAFELLKKREVQRFLVDENGKITPLPIVFPNCPLKEHEAVEPIRINTNYEQHWKCGNCKAVISVQDKYCHECGRSVKWE